VGEEITSYWVIFKKNEKIVDIERRSTRLHSLENSLWKRL